MRTSFVHYLKRDLKHIIVILIFFPAFVLAQDDAALNREIDSLKQVVKHAENDTIKIKAIEDWDARIYINDPELDFELNEQILDLCTLNLTRNLSTAETKFYLKALGGSLNILGILSRENGDLEKSLEFHDKSTAVYGRIHDQKGIAAALNNSATVFKIQGDYAKAVDYNFRSLKIQEAIGDQNGASISLNNIGQLYNHQEEFDLAATYYRKSLELDRKMGNEDGVGRVMSNLGVIYSKQQKYDLALAHYDSSIAVYQKLGDSSGVARVLNNVGIVFLEQNQLDSALSYFLTADRIYEEEDNVLGLAATRTNISSIHFKLNNIHRSIEIGEQALVYARQIESLIILADVGEILWNDYRKTGDYRKALEMYELHISTRDSITSEKNQAAVIRQQFKYEYEKHAEADSIRTAELTKIKDAELAAERAENSRRKAQSYFLYVGLGLALLFGVFIFNRFRVARKQKVIIEDQKVRVDNAYDELEEKNREILDSINYAKRIQNAILPPQKTVRDYLKNSFVLYKPKDIVAGDFYWLEVKGDTVLFAAADCTGHGVPGAMVSVVCNNGLNRSVREHGLTDPGKILDKTREIIIEEFGKSDDEVKDGMDISLCALNGNQLKWAGANNPLWLIRSDEFVEYKPDKQPIGKYANETSFHSHAIELQAGDSVYIFTDGYTDQFGGEKGKKFKAANLKQFLMKIRNESMDRQRQLIESAFETWRGNLEQVDDVCIIGVKI